MTKAEIQRDLNKQIIDRLKTLEFRAQGFLQVVTDKNSENDAYDRANISLSAIEEEMDFLMNLIENTRLAFK